MQGPPSGCGMGAHSRQGRMPPGQPLSPCKAKAAPGDGDGVPTGSQSSALAPHVGDARETWGLCRQPGCRQRELFGAGEPGKATRSLFKPCKSKVEGCKEGRVLGRRVVLGGWGEGNILAAAAVVRVVRWAPRWGRARVSRSGAGCCRDQHNQPR